MNGSGIATAARARARPRSPEKTTARPAVSIVRTTASSCLGPRRAPPGSGRRSAASSRPRSRARSAGRGSSRRSASRRGARSSRRSRASPVIVQAAKRNGIVTAHESPKTASSTSSAIGIAIDSPFVRSCVEDRVEVVLDRRRRRSRRRARRPPAARARAAASSVYAFACATSSVETMSPKTTCGPAASSVVGLPVGTTVAARSTSAPAAARRAPGRARPATRKTTVNEPSGRSPKCCSSTLRTRSESVPGHREGVREERRELRAREAADQEDDDPDGDHAAAVPQHEARPPGHGQARVTFVMTRPAAGARSGAPAAIRCRA